MRVIACRTAYGKGGLGQHFAQLVEESRASGELTAYYAHTHKAGDEKIARTVDFVRLRFLKKYTPLRFSPQWAAYVGERIFDKRIAAALDIKATCFMGFVGKSLFSFEKARALGYGTLELIAANSHVRNVQRMHAIAAKQHGVKDTWLNEALARKTMREYEMADYIYTHAAYTRQSLIDEGISPAKLRHTSLAVHPKFTPPARKPDDGIFRVVYAGRVDATKGIPLLIKAFKALSNQRAELTLVGGCATRKMKTWFGRLIGGDKRIKFAPGDPLKPFQEADVYVHPSYEDGFAYAPMEALACGVPAIVTEDTGMKEYIVPGENGYIVPTGDWKAILERMEQVRKYPLASVAPLVSEPLIKS
ncbi:MAG: glycosyltransferase [Bacteroidota bacterium]